MVIDTSAVLALLVPTDVRHREAGRAFAKLAEAQSRLLTTSYTLVECYALIDRRIGRDAVRRFRSEFAPLLDVIWVGADEHERSLDIVDECGLTYLHVFPFSARKGTPAARMPQVARPIIKERAACFRAKGEKVRDAFLAGQTGATHAVLIERTGTASSMGRTPHFAEIKVSGAASSEPGDIITARVTGFADGQLVGESMTGEAVLGEVGA